jgi:hypothetical protein
LGPRWSATGVIEASMALTSKTSSAYPKVTCLETDAQDHGGVELGEYRQRSRISVAETRHKRLSGRVALQSPARYSASLTFLR